MEQTFDLLRGADRLQDVSFSPIRVIMEKAREMGSRGIPVVSFSAGEPNFNTPETIKQATIEALEQNLTHYSSNRGVLELRQEIAVKMKKESGAWYDPETEILVTNSGAEAINNALTAVLDEGDEVIIFKPAFINYESVVKMCGAKVVEIPLKPEDGFQINIAEVESKVTEKTKMVIMNNPCNPTGVVYSKEVLQDLASLAVKYNFLIFSDEIYNCLTYDKETFTSIASIEGMKEHAIIMNGFSKTYAMTGWRVGYILADTRLMPHIVKVHQYSTTSGNTFIQTALSKTMNLDETMRDVEYMRSQFEARRDLITGLLKEIPQFSFIQPKGAFYIMVDVSGTGMDGSTFAQKLLEEKYVAVVPAVGLGRECGDYIRISFATSDENIYEGMKRIREFTKAL